MYHAPEPYYPEPVYHAPEPYYDEHSYDSYSNKSSKKSKKSNRHDYGAMFERGHRMKQYKNRSQNHVHSSVVSYDSGHGHHERPDYSNVFTSLRKAKNIASKYRKKTKT